MVASWLAHVFLSHLERNERASMAIRKRFGFSCKEESYGQMTYAEVVVIHHDVLKSTTSARRRGAWCATCKNRLVALVHLVILVQPNKRDKPNKPHQPACFCALLTTTSGAGGGFRHMMVDINHAYVRHLPIRLLFARKSEPFPYGHAGTRIALQVGQEHVSR